MLCDFFPGSFQKRSRFFHLSFYYARVERFELPSTVLETAILPLNYTRLSNDPYFRAAKIRFIYKKQVHLIRNALVLIC